MSSFQPLKVLFATAMGRSSRPIAASPGHICMATELHKKGIQTHFFPYPLQPENSIAFNKAKMEDYFNSTHFELALEIEIFKPSVLAVSLLDENLVVTQKFLEKIRAEFPEVIFAAGGIFPTAFPGHARAHFGDLVEIICSGDADLSFARLLTFLDKPGELKKIPGIRVRIESEVLVDTLNHAYRLTSEEFNALEPDYRLMKEDVESGEAIRLITSRGCRRPACSFCLAARLHGKGTFWSAEKIIYELKRIKNLIEGGELGPEAKYILIDDLDFIQYRERAVAFFKLFREQGLDFYFDKLKFETAVSSFFIKDKSGKATLEVDKELFDLISAVSRNLTLQVDIGADFYTANALKRNKEYLYTQEHVELLANEFRKRKIFFKLASILTDEQTDMPEYIESLKTMEELWKNIQGVGWFDPPHRSVIAYFGSRLYMRTLAAGKPARPHQLLQIPALPQYDYPILPYPRINPLLFDFITDPATQSLWENMVNSRAGSPVHILIRLREFLSVKMKEADQQTHLHLKRFIDEIGERFRSPEDYKASIKSGPDNALKRWMLKVED